MGLRIAWTAPVHCPEPDCCRPPTNNVPTADIDRPVADPVSAKQLEVLAANWHRVRHHLLPDG